MERISVFDIYKIGVGPSSSHTLGPWKAARRFLDKLKGQTVVAIEIELFGSLAKTGKGHGTDVAVMLGLQGLAPETIDPDQIPVYVQAIKDTHLLNLGSQAVFFDPSFHIKYNRYALAFHPNALKFRALLPTEQWIEETYYSIGGGFICTLDQADLPAPEVDFPFPIESGKDILRHTSTTGKAISDIVLANELQLHDEPTIKKKMMSIWHTMLECVYRGCHSEGILPGGLNVKKRAKKLSDQLLNNQPATDREQWLEAIRKTGRDFTTINKWVSCFALAVNEENASFGRIVTSPTNGAAGVVPAVLLYHYCFGDYQGEDDIVRFLLTSAEIGSLFKKGATISAAAGGCQAEIGVSSAMAAGGLTELMGGTPSQVLMAAEIAMEHHLGLTCDPIGGLVQIPCIERNTMGAIKAITASNLALSGNPEDTIVQLDTVIRTMWDTAQDMSEKYKETAEGGLALHVPIILPNC